MVASEISIVKLVMKAWSTSDTFLVLSNYRFGPLITKSLGKGYDHYQARVENDRHVGLLDNPSKKL